jgi:hypothetical protein
MPRFAPSFPQLQSSTIQNKDRLSRQPVAGRNPNNSDDSRPIILASSTQVLCSSAFTHAALKHIPKSETASGIVSTFIFAPFHCVQRLLIQLDQKATVQRTATERALSAAKMTNGLAVCALIFFAVSVVRPSAVVFGRPPCCVLGASCHFV